MHALFLVCLVAGMCSTAIMAMLGGVAGHVGHGIGHLHASHPGPSLAAGHGHAALPGNGPAQHVPGPASSVHAAASPPAQSPATAVLGWALSWLSPLVIASAALWFGAGGLIADLVAPGVSGPVAVVAALAGGAAVRKLIDTFVQSDTEPLSADATGAIGVLNAAIRVDTAGEVVYVLEGLHRSAAARSVDGSPLPRGTNVVIVRREKGVALVSPLDPLSPLIEPENGATPVEQVPQRQSEP